ncbi:MAG: acyl-CoA reductase [Ignavibacteriaceae bacterium]|nr:acyl-CoA reductase [Ignavibacteriaceae bacterium]
MNVTVFAPKHNPGAELEIIINNNFISQKPLPSFDSASIEFLSALSKEILETKGIKSYPELVALAYWLRKSNIISIAEQFKTGISNSEVIVPRGIAFHIAPSNVDSIFLYSWALSLLAGNINIVRVSQTLNPQLEMLFYAIRKVLEDENLASVAQRNILLTYPREESINRFISLRSDVRVLWGGDETINNIRLLPAKPATKDITFADKFSYSVIKSSSYNMLDADGKSKLANQFYNDAYWFDQMACSSPRFILFAGSNKENEQASASFRQFLNSELTRKGKVDTIDVAMEKLVYMYESLSKTDASSKPELPKSGEPAVVRVDKSEISKFRETCGGGFFFECFIENLLELSLLVSRKDQTLAYSGFNKEELCEFAAKVNGAGVDRIVPIGQALNFAPIWDGYSLLNELTKRVHIII